MICKKYKRENTKSIVIINEQHKLLDEQKKILEEKYEVYAETGWQLIWLYKGGHENGNIPKWCNYKQ